MKTWRDLVPLIEALPGSVGCCWHVVVEDGNISRGFIAACKATIKPGHEACSTLAAVIDDYSLTQISKAVKR